MTIRFNVVVGVNPIMVAGTCRVAAPHTHTVNVGPHPFGRGADTVVGFRRGPLPEFLEVGAKRTEQNRRSPYKDRCARDRFLSLMITHPRAKFSGSAAGRPVDCPPKIKLCRAGTTTSIMIGPISMPPTIDRRKRPLHLTAYAGRDCGRQQADAGRQCHHQDRPHLLFDGLVHRFDRIHAAAGDPIIAVDDEDAAHHRHAEEAK